MKHGLVAFAIVLAAAGNARAQDDTPPPPPPPPEVKPKLLLGNTGESCRTSEDCAAGLGCIAGTCGSRTAKPEKPLSPVEHYRNLSFSLLSDAGASFTFQTGQDLLVLSLGASMRLVLQGFVIGAQLSVVYEKASALGSSFEIGAVEPGITLGYAFAVSDRVAIMPSAHALFFLPFTNTSTSISVGEFTGEIAATCFVGMNGFIEPYVAAGDYQPLSNGSAAFLFAIGYRIGVVF